MLDSLLAEGIKYVFVSNSDNLGATLDLKLLNHFASTSQPFCCLLYTSPSPRD